MIIIFVMLSVLFALSFYFNLIFITVVIGMSFIVLTEVAMKDYQKRMDKYGFSKKKRKIFSIFILLFWLFALAFVFRFAFIELTEIVEIINSQNLSVRDSFANKIGPYIPEFITSRISIGEIINIGGKYTISTFSNFLAVFSSFLIVAVIVIPLMFYMYFKRKDEILVKIRGLVPKKFDKGFFHASNEIGGQLHDFLRGKVIQGIFLTLIFCLGFYIIGVKGWLLFGVLGGILNIVPYIGPVIAAVPPLLVTLLIDDPIISLYVVLIAIGAQVIDNFYLTPFMLSEKVRMDPLLSIFIVLIGARLWGALGMILAVPIYLVYKITLKESYNVLVEVYGDG